MNTQVNPKQSFWSALKSVFTDRQSAAMLILGLASGLPYVAIGGTLNAWMTTVNVKTSTIGLLSWASLAYVYKFMWAPAFQNRRTPFNLKFGPRQFWMAVFIIPIAIFLYILSNAKPPDGLVMIGAISVIIAILSASFDIVLAAWRIESARDDQQLDILSTLEQFGYRTASIFGGLVALIMADHLGWVIVFQSAAGLMAFCLVGVFLAKPVEQIRLSRSEREKVRIGRYLEPKTRNLGTIVVLAGWGISLFLLGRFMFGALQDPMAHNARDFTKGQGLIVIGLTLILLLVVAGGLTVLNDRAKKSHPELVESPRRRGFLGIMYASILEPMMDFYARYGRAVILIVAVVMTYRFTDLIWGSFAYPFYLGENYGALHHTLSEVGVASKLVGVFATMVGIALGGALMLKFGRMPILLIGGILAAATNLLFADLATGAVFMDKFMAVTHFDALMRVITKILVAVFQTEVVALDQRMLRLISAIFMENIAVGIASAASVAYLSSVVNKNYAATQYALLGSLAFLFGILGRPWVGEIIEEKGFAYAFILCAALGGVAVILVILEWIRQPNTDTGNKAPDT